MISFRVYADALKSVSVSAVSVAVLSETTDSTEEEWQSIADLATACRSILEALSREGGDKFTRAHLLVQISVVFQFVVPHMVLSETLEKLWHLVVIFNCCCFSNLSLL